MDVTAADTCVWQCPHMSRNLGVTIMPYNTERGRLVQASFVPVFILLPASICALVMA